MKYGLWLAVGVIAWLWFGHVRRQQLRDRERGRPLHQAAPDHAQHAAHGATPVAIEAIVACRHCGLHVPLSDAVVTPAGARFCSEAHRRLHPAA